MIIHRDYQILYRDLINYTTIIMKNRSKNYFKKSKTLVNNSENTIFSNSKNIKENSAISNYNELKNPNGTYSSNELSFLVYSSNQDTNKFKRNALFGNILSISKEKDNIRFNSYLKDSIINSNINSNYKYLENNKNINNFYSNKKNEIKIDEQKINQLSSIKRQNYNTSIKRDYNNLFDNENNISLNDYLNLYQNDEIDNNNNFSNGNLEEDDTIPTPKVSEKNQNFQKHEKSAILNNNLEQIKEENKRKNIINEELFNTHIKDKISKIKDDIISNNIIKQENKDFKKNSKYINSKLKVDKYIDYYDLLSKELEQRDESKELENIFCEFFSQIKYRFWKKDSYADFIYSLNNCQLFNLIKLNKENNNSNCFDTLMSNMELSNNKNLSNSNLYSSKSELLRDGSHSINDSQSTQTIENQIEKNITLISKFPKLVMPQSIIPEESSNFLYSNNDYILNRSFGEPIEENNLRTNLMEVQEIEEEKNILYEENIEKELYKIGINEEININNIFENMNSNNIFNEEKKINEDLLIKEYKTKIFYDILLIAQNKTINIIQKKPFGIILKQIQ